MTKQDTMLHRPRFPGQYGGGTDFRVDTCPVTPFRASYPPKVAQFGPVPANLQGVWSR